MYQVISITDPGRVRTLISLCEELDIPLSLVMHGRGTASKSVLDLLGIASGEKRIVFTLADEQKTAEFIRRQRRSLYIDAPGNGVVLTIPMKSVGGGETLAHLRGNQPAAFAPPPGFEHELVIAIVNEGHTDEVMDAARAGGAKGGTILHGKGTGARSAAKFFQVSLAQEKEMLFIVARAARKGDIMAAILEQAGPSTPAGAIVFSLPVSAVAGFNLTDEQESEGPTLAQP